MKTLLLTGTLVAAMVLLPEVSRCSITVLSEDFTGATISVGTTGAGGTAYIQGVTNWYSTQPNVGGAPAGLVTDNTSPLSGNVANFSGGSGNGNLVGAFTPVTLTAGGTNSITLTLDYRATTLPTTYGPLIGLYNDGGTAVAGNQFYSGVAPAVLQDDKGYNVEKTLNASTSDIFMHSETASATSGKNTFYNFGNQAILATASSGINANNTTSVYSMGLTLTLQSNGDLLVASSFGGVTNSTTVLAVNVLTTTFNEVAITPSAQYTPFVCKSAYRMGAYSNYAGLLTTDSVNLGIAPSLVNTNWGGVQRPFAALPNPAATSFMLEMGVSFGYSFYSVPSFVYPHNGKMNVLFCDGHVEARTKAETPTAQFDVFYTGNIVTYTP